MRDRRGRCTTCRVRGSRGGSTWMGIGAAVLVAALGTAEAATPAQTCQLGKNKAAGKYDSCRQTAEAKLATTGDAVKYAEALVKCQAKYATTWATLEAKATAAGAACPSVGDEAAIQSLIDATTTNIATALAGDALVDCPTALATCASDGTTCTSQLATCQATPKGKRLKTGQTISGGLLDDGFYEKGLARSYTDNGNGTITDDRTGLTWEKLSYDGSIHDWRNVYTWPAAIGTKVQALNVAQFAGFADWRLPNIEELESLVNYGAYKPASFPAFRSNCVPSCTVLTCSCFGDAAGNGAEFWTSTSLYLPTMFPSAPSAWTVRFENGFVQGPLKTDSRQVRAVRGG